ncbi:hypothetical protein RclHR1_00840007 [Rhizophagus clarus]|uniref:Myb/SANT-like DNA-binding domain-containing protein n=1 Tax=Rhizophagus clarus TaxID=94130 RepID=A0A2Z6S0S8_9GLOM|nr:hypothetical protein RclHR1_00840007 [Rhizophagus clarus]
MSSNIPSSNAINTVNPHVSAVNTNVDTHISNNNTNDTMTDNTDNTGSEWNERTIRLLIDQRKHRNREYYQIIGRSRRRYWDSVARRINRVANSDFTGIQCKRKFNSLDICYFMWGDDRGRYTDIGEKYFEEFSTLFWHRPASTIQNVQRTNTLTHRRRNRDNAQ